MSALFARLSVLGYSFPPQTIPIPTQTGVRNVTFIVHAWTYDIFSVWPICRTPVLTVMLQYCHGNASSPLPPLSVAEVPFECTYPSVSPLEIEYGHAVDFSTYNVTAGGWCRASDLFSARHQRRNLRLVVPATVVHAGTIPLELRHVFDHFCHEFCMFAMVSSILLHALMLFAGCLFLRPSSRRSAPKDTFITTSARPLAFQ